jgi:hypothetical protein
MLSHPGSARILEFPVISSFTAYGVRSPFLSRPFLDRVEVPSPKTKLVQLKWPTPSPEEAMTPTNSQKQSSISSAATLENLHINTCITEYTSIKRINTTLEFLLCKKRKKIPLKMLVTPSPFASQNGRCQANPTTPIQRQMRERAKNEDADGDYISADAGPHPRVGADALDRREWRRGSERVNGGKHYKNISFTQFQICCST